MNFKKIAKVALVTISLSVCTSSALGRSANNYDWNPLMDAITKVESGGDRKAVNGNQCGAMQITPVMVKECNNILKSRGNKRRYTLQDRFSVKKSREMFVVFMSEHNRTNNIERAVRMWNGGVHYTQRSTQSYYQKVMAVYKA